MGDNKVNRRKFVKNSALMAGGVMTMPLGASAFYSGTAEEDIRVALIGCGGRGTGAAAQAMQAHPKVKLVAMADAFMDRLEDSLKNLKEAMGDEANSKIEVPDSRKYAGFDAYKKAIQQADVVILTTPPGFRPIHFKEAIAQDKHVFMEKPVATDPAGIQSVLDTAQTAKSKKLNVVVGLQRRYQNSYLELMKRYQDGMVGDLTSAQVFWNSRGVWVRPRKANMNEMEYQMRNWYYFNWLCGDHIVEQHIHNIDVFNWFKDDFPAKAQGMGGRTVRVGKEYGEIFDHHFVEYTFADGSIMNAQCRHQPGTYGRVDEVLTGTKGRIYCNQARIEDLDGNTVFQFDRGEKENNPYQTEHDLLFDAISKGEFKFANAEYAAHTTLSAIVGRLATYSGQVIDHNTALNSGMSIQPEEYSWEATPPVLPGEDGLYPCAVPGETEYFKS